LTLGNSCIERLQAARHSTLLMCVAASQKPMQSASDLPPPPGLLGAASLALPLPDEVPGERASEEPLDEPPPVANWLGKGGDIGDSGGTVDPGCAVVGAVGLGETGGEVAVGAESRGLGAGDPPADERACANAASGSSSERAMATRTGRLGVSIEITILPAIWLTTSRHFWSFTTWLTCPVGR